MSIKNYEYNPQSLKELTVKELRKEYMSNKRAIQSSVEKLEDKYPESKALDRIPEQKNYKNMRKNELVYRIIQQHRWLESPYSSPEKMKAINTKISNSLLQSGIKVRPDKLKEFGEFMDKMRDLKQDVLYDSRVLALAYANSRRRKGIKNILNLTRSELKNLNEEQYTKVVNQAQGIFEEIEGDEPDVFI